MSDLIRKTKPRVVGYVPQKKLVKKVRQALGSEISFERVATPASLVKCLRNTRVDAVCLDIRTLDNWQGVAQTVQTLGYSLPIILIDDNRQQPRLGDLPEKGVWGYVTVSAIPDDLYGRVQSAIEYVNNWREGLLRDSQVFQTHIDALNSHLTIMRTVKNPVQLDQSQQRAFELVNFLYHADPRGGEKKKRVFSQETTEGGVAEIVINEKPFIIKRVRTKRVEQTKIDIAHFRDNPEMPLETLVASLVREDVDYGYLIKERVQGANLTDLLLAIKESVRDGSNPPEGLMGLRDRLIDIALERIKYWQYQAPEVRDENDRQLVIDFYKKNAYRAIVAVSTNTGGHIDDAEFRFIRTALGAFDFPRIVTEDTIKRNFAATYRNMIYMDETGVFPPGDMEYAKGLLRKIMNGSRRRQDLSNRIVHVDTHRKYSHLLEDILEVTHAFEVGLNEVEVEGWLKKAIEKYDLTLQGSLREAVPLLAVYRNLRKAYFFAERFGPQAVAQLTNGELSKTDYHRRIISYNQNMSHHLVFSLFWLDRMINEKREGLADIPIPEGMRVNGHTSFVDYIDVVAAGLFPPSDVTISPSVEFKDSYWTGFKDLAKKVSRARASAAAEKDRSLPDYVRLKYLSTVLHRIGANDGLNYKDAEPFLS